MNYYERHLGDYARDTGHLSMLEHGAYTLLMDRYYVCESGIPEEQAHRLAHARSKEEKLAVDAVLKEFFKLKDGVWVKGRIEEEIAKAQTKIKAAQENGKRGGRPKTNPSDDKNKPTGLSMGSENETQVKAHQPPDTNHQTPDINKPHTVETLTTVEPTQIGRVCSAIKSVYDMANQPIMDMSQSHPTFTALIEAGATVDEFTDAASRASQIGKGFGYLLGIVRRQREEALNLNLHKGAMPATTSREQGRNIAAKSIFTPENTRHLQGNQLTTIEVEHEQRAITA